MTTDDNDTPYLGNRITRREFVTISSMTSLSLCSQGSLFHASSVVRSSAPFRAKLVSLEGWVGEPDVFGRIRQSLSRQESDVIVLCSADPQLFAILVEKRSSINSSYGLRRLLVHRPLNLVSINRTLDQIHSDSERFDVDGWEIPAENFDSTTSGAKQIGHLNLILKLIARTHIPIISIAPKKGWSENSLVTLTQLSTEFRDVKFVVLGTRTEFWQSLLATRDKLIRERFLTENMNVYFALDISDLPGDVYIDSTRALWGQPYFRKRHSLITDLFAGRDYRYLSQNLADVYSLHPLNYRYA